MCNPIENVFSELKAEFRKMPDPVSTDMELKQKIEIALLPFRHRNLSNHIQSVLNLSLPINLKCNF